MGPPREGYVPVGEGGRPAMTGERRTGTPDLGERAEVTVVLRRATPVQLPAEPAVVSCPIRSAPRRHGG